METWKPVLGYEKEYVVSDFGKVKSLERLLSPKIKTGLRGGRRAVKERILKQTFKKYAYVNLSKQGIVCAVPVHRLVLEAFVGPCPDGMMCRHFPDRKTNNNRRTNLVWGTALENQRDRIFHGTNNGWRRPRVLSLDEVKRIKKEYGKTTRYKRGKVTQRGLAEKYGVSLSTINEAVTGKLLRK